MRRGHPLLIKNSALQHIKIFPFTCCKPVPPCILFLALSPQPLYSPFLPLCILSSSSVLSLSALSPQPLYSPSLPLCILSLHSLFSLCTLPLSLPNTLIHSGTTIATRGRFIRVLSATTSGRLGFKFTLWDVIIRPTKNGNKTELYINVVFLRLCLLFTPLAREMAANFWDSEIR